MKIHSKKLAYLLLVLAIFLPACGILEVGIEQPTATSRPPLATATPLPTATASPVPVQVKSGSPVKITRINMLDANNGWGVGQVETDLADHVLYTNDGGKSWRDVTPTDALAAAPPQGVNAIPFFNADEAWVMFASQTPQIVTLQSQTVWHSQDRGKTWESSVLSFTGLQMEFFTPFQLGFLDAQHGWVIAHVGAGMSHDYVAAFTTADGGKTWKRVIDNDKSPALMGCQKTGLAFSTAANGWLVGDCPGLLTNLFFYSTADGGQTWQLASLPPPSRQPADLFSGRTAACGIPNLVYLTARTTFLTVRCDMSVSRQTVAWLYTGKLGVMDEGHPLPLPFGAIQFLNTSEGWMVGSAKNDPSAPGEIYHTIDGGVTWNYVIGTGWQGTPNFINSKVGWVLAHLGSKTVLVFSSDGGFTWAVISPVIR